MKYLVGTMIELLCVCVVADQIAKEAQFFSFGTNDLTQTTLGMSGDDYGTFIRYYQENDIAVSRADRNHPHGRRRRLDEDRGRKGPGGAAGSERLASAANTAANPTR